jgi:hypothetical protein
MAIEYDDEEEIVSRRTMCWRDVVKHMKDVEKEKQKQKEQPETPHPFIGD